jgi:hypothetical protein
VSGQRERVVGHSQDVDPLESPWLQAAYLAGSIARTIVPSRSMYAVAEGSPGAGPVGLVALLHRRCLTSTISGSPDLTGARLVAYS